MPFVNLTGQRNAYRDELEAAERAVLDSGCYIGGPEVKALEGELAAFCGDSPRGKVSAVTCGSGTEALTLALLALGVAPGDEVIVPDFTFIACAECVSMLGARPVFADIDPETLQILPGSAEVLVGPKTRGIIAVDLFGQCAPYTELRRIADEHGLWIIEDAAQAFGATTGGQRACTFGDIAITSFYPSKPLGCYGDGGAVFTPNVQLAEMVRMLANHGSRERYLHESVGVNSRLDALQAAVLRVKLRHLEDELKVRRENARKYDEFFGSLNGGLNGSLNGAKIVPQKIAEGNTSTYAQYTVLAENRKAFIDKLDAAGIPHCIHYPMALHCQPCFAGASDTAGLNGTGLNAASLNGAAGLNNATRASETVVSLPVCAFTDVDFILNKLRSVL